MKTWNLTRHWFVNGKRRLTIWIVTDEKGVQVCSNEDQRAAVESALRIAAKENRGAVQVVGD